MTIKGLQHGVFKQKRMLVAVLRLLCHLHRAQEGARVNMPLKVTHYHMLFSNLTCYGLAARL
jgi:fumarate reductase subunit D